MFDRLFRLPEPSSFRWPAFVIIVGAIAVLLLFRWQGLLLLVPLFAIAVFMLGQRPNSSEEATLRSSIALSAEDIEDVLAEFDAFCNDPNADALADRTLHLPALLDRDSDDPDIASFHHHYSTAKRFLTRLPARLANPHLEVSQLESLLTVTDQRAAEVQQAWLAARQAAKRLGPGGHRGL